MYIVAREFPFGPGRGYLTEVTDFGVPVWNSDPNKAHVFDTWQEAEAFIARHDLGEVMIVPDGWTPDPDRAMRFETKEEVEDFIARNNLRDARPMWLED